MRAAERERFIVDEAVRFFAEQGFGGQTREFAKRMGITHSAIYRHFPSKEALIERVYEEIYLSRWSPSWSDLIRDRSLPLQTRLTRFYLEYVERVFEYNWVRIFVFSGMKSFDIICGTFLAFMYLWIAALPGVPMQRTIRCNRPANMTSIFK